MNGNGINGAGSNSGTNQSYLKSQQTQTEDTLPRLRKVSEIYGILKEDILQRDGIIRYPFGLTELDEKTGGLHKKELMCIAAESSHGKSAFSVNTLINLADKGVRVAYFSLEMASEQIVERILTNICEIDNQDLRFGRALPLVEMREDVFRSWIEKTNILIDDRYGYDLDSVIKIADELRPDFIFIDYVQMANTKGKSKVEGLEEYVRGIKKICTLYGIGGVLLSQMNRNTGASDIDRLKWSSVLREHPDCVLTLNWDWEKQAYKIRISKQRNGVVGSVMVKFKPQYSKFFDLTEQEKQETEDDKRPSERVYQND